jgi:tetratricopeptide (TPR) repeat protein
VTNLLLPTFARKDLGAPFLLTLAVTLLSAGCQVASDGHNAQGVRDFQQGNYPQALQRFQQAARTDPSNADSFYNMAATMHRQGIDSRNRELLNQAEQLYNQCLDLEKDHADAYRGLAVLLNETDRPDKAFKLLKNWVATSPRASDAHVELARLHEEFGDRESAKTHLQEALSLDQENYRAWTAMAHIREKEQDYRQALANYQRSYAIRGQPQIAERMATISRGLSTNTPTSTGGSRTVQTDNGRTSDWNSRY